MTYYIEHSSPLGKLLLAATEKGLCGLYFEEHKYFKGKNGWVHDASQPHLRRAASQLDEYFARRRNNFDVDLDLAGTPFQRKVWQELAAIPFGHTSSYAQIASRIGMEHAIRAVGAAIGRNPVCMIIPCHRVVRADGELGGYAGGLERKRFLLAFEASALDLQRGLAAAA